MVVVVVVIVVVVVVEEKVVVGVAIVVTVEGEKLNVLIKNGVAKRKKNKRGNGG